jgi:hypothetical protein
MKRNVPGRDASFPNRIEIVSNGKFVETNGGMAGQNFICAVFPFNL